MNYTQQEEYLKRSRIRAVACAAPLLGAASASLRTAGPGSTLVVVEFWLAVIALVVSLCYTPDYLQLTVNPERKARWQIKIRWRIVGAILFLSMLSYFSVGVGAWVVAAILWLLAVNLFAQKLRVRRYCFAYFWSADFILLAALLAAGQGNLVLGAFLLAAAAHLSIVICEDHTFQWAAAMSFCALFLLLAAGVRRAAGAEFLGAASGLLLASALGTAWLVSCAQQQNIKNVQVAMRELATFTGYSAERIRELWSISDRELAKNWQKAKLKESDAERMAEWYRQNSELYVFAICAYNLEYKRIRSNLKVLRLASGSCLDYGAGNGELILELARRGHPATYFDVEGESMKFATQRAQQQGFTVKFLRRKDDLIRTARERGFATVYSLDVLEHLPDLPGELKFLSSLLSPGGLLIFDVPAGSTKSHPMHLNHHLDVCAFLKAQGLEEKRSLLSELAIGKQEKYIFQRSK